MFLNISRKTIFLLYSLLPLSMKKLMNFVFSNTTGWQDVQKLTFLAEYQLTNLLIALYFYW